MNRFPFSVFRFPFLLLIACCLMGDPAGRPYAYAATGESFILQSDGWHAPSKQAGEVKDYTLIWSNELAGNKAAGWQPGDDTIASATWTYDPGLTGGPAAIGPDPSIPGSTANSVVTWLAGGASGKSYNVSVTFTTAKGRTEVFRFKIWVY